MNKKYLLFAMVFLALPLVMAGNYTLSFKPGEEINIYILCLKDNGDVCDNVANCTFTAFYPNSTLLLKNVTMTNNLDGYYNYSLGYLNVTGTYSGVASCTDVLYGTTSFNFIIGHFENWILLALLGVTLSLSFVPVVISKRVVKGKEYLKEILFALAIIFSLFVMQLGHIMVNNYTSSSAILSVHSALYYVMLFVFFIFITFIMIGLFVRALDLYKIRRGLK